MIVTNRLKNQHLLWRAAFGPMAENAASLDSISTTKLWQLLLKSSAEAPQKFQVSSGLGDGLYKGLMDAAAMKDDNQKKQMQKQRRAQSRDELKNLNVLWLDDMINSKAQLREKMGLFWHGHFACRVVNSYFQQELLQTVRENALGNFGELLVAVSKSPSMLQFLNNQQNKKQHPNENFAREVMELFTIGRGNYTESDIKEAARAFTGWSYNQQGEFVFRKFNHDSGTKTFMGKTGNFTGDDILNILLQQKGTATFITRKLYRYLVNEKDLTPKDEAHIATLAAGFYKDNYDIKSLLTSIFTSDWFYNPEYIGTKIKSPIELLAGIRRFLPMELDNDNAQLLFQKVLGQILFYPPNVAGWPGGKNWIDSSTLMVRLQIPQVLAAKESLTIKPKNDDDMNMGQVMEQQVKLNRNKMYTQRGGSADIAWAPVYKVFEKVHRDKLLNEISGTLLQAESRLPDAVMMRYLADGSREDFIKSAVIQYMSTPEYQLC
ncbi:MAG: DUF1800 domain-containing protein [Ferruginibacter sp.]